MCIQKINEHLISAKQNKARGALEGIRVLDLSRLLPGPFCSTILADHGATVTVIEAPQFRNSSVIASVPMVQRNKRHVAVDLKQDAGREIFMKLASKADVILEAFRPGVVRNLRVDYESITRLNPRIIYCSLSGYGQYGPLAKKAVHDLNCMAFSGVLDLLRDANHVPIEPGIPFAGLIGGLSAALGILIALQARHATGVGQYIDISMSDALISLLALPMANAYQPDKASDYRDFSEVSRNRPFYRSYRTKDNRYITVGALEKHLWLQFCTKLGCPFYAEKQEDKEVAEEIVQYLEHTFRQRNLEEWMVIFNDADDCVAPLLSGYELIEQSHVAAREMLYVSSSGVPQPGIAVKLTATPGSIRNPEYRFGEHTREILMELGYDEREVAILAASGTVWGPDIEAYQA